ncbi:PD-(D/E)XK nuclease domain-containing protein [Arcicella sp. DC2W]|uniref:PD-(D/E)XK nuclease domain-containing protein n=1 Tax=Arcicella gelida TaxID=2984195 RepID=A0ABU5S4M4_9BACT|nr:PD-(D/E)XK nuclease domain-containing protein [Arcicella sp. DC2W]MEA5403385.1 PD-(D/E)XK nuclease domain-containing protein [Arcicella sp. DC2W]
MKIKNKSSFKDEKTDLSYFENWVRQLEKNNDRQYERIEIETSLGKTHVWGLHTKEEHLETLVTFSLLGVYIQSEVQTSDGRMDALIRMKDVVYCIEFKLDESAEKAIQQIKDKGYLQPFSAKNKKLVAIGINFSSGRIEVGGNNKVVFYSVVTSATTRIEY